MAEQGLSKKEWGEGEWQNEPDFEEFVYLDHPCYLVRADSGGWCGYVGIPNDHYYATQGNARELEVHGDVSWSEGQLPFGIHKMYPTAYWIGFDCSHLGDYMPKYDKQLEILRNTGTKDGSLLNRATDRIKSVCDEIVERPKTYRNIEFARNELKRLVEQIVGFKKEKE